LVKALEVWRVLICQRGDNGTQAEEAFNANDAKLSSSTTSLERQIDADESLLAHYGALLTAVRDEQSKGVRVCLSMRMCACDETST
jgi:hypothetical protein